MALLRLASHKQHAAAALRLLGGGGCGHGQAFSRVGWTKHATASAGCAGRLHRLQRRAGRSCHCCSISTEHPPPPTHTHSPHAPHPLQLHTRAADAAALPYVRAALAKHSSHLREGRQSRDDRVGMEHNAGRGQHTATPLGACVACWQ